MESGTIQRIKKPSVSELISLLDKPALLNWANKQGLKGIDISKERGKWLSAGTSLHKQIEKYERDKTPFEDKANEQSYKNFIYGKEILEMEKNIETDYFIGRFDCKMKFDDRIFICDYKSSNGVYFENKLQLVAYSMAEPCDAFAIINIPSFQFNIITIKDRTPYEEILKSLSIIYNAKKTIDGN